MRRGAAADKGRRQRQAQGARMCLPPSCAPALHLPRNAASTRCRRWRCSPSAWCLSSGCGPWARPRPSGTTGSCVGTRRAAHACACWAGVVLAGAWPPPATPACPPRVPCNCCSPGEGIWALLAIFTVFYVMRELTLWLALATFKSDGGTSASTELVRSTQVGERACSQQPPAGAGRALVPLSCAPLRPAASPARSLLLTRRCRRSTGCRSTWSRPAGACFAPTPGWAATCRRAWASWALLSLKRHACFSAVLGWRCRWDARMQAGCSAAGACSTLVNALLRAHSPPHNCRATAAATRRTGARRGASSCTTSGPGCSSCWRRRAAR